jgi:hypothetical protein
MFHALNTAIYTPHVGGDAGGVGPSSRLWSHLANIGTPDGANPVSVMGDDFLGDFEVAASQTSAVRGAVPWAATTGANSTFARLNTEYGGVVRATAGTADDRTAAFGAGLAGGMLAFARGTPGAVTSKGGKVLFEARVRKASITNAHSSMFLGVVEVNKLATTNIIHTAGTALAAVNAVGFWNFQAAGATLRRGYVAGTGANAVTSGTTTLVAATWVKLGFLYDPAKPASRRLSWFVNGVEQADYVTGAVIGENANAAGVNTFPAGRMMAPAFALVRKDNDSTADIDWVYCAAERVD